MENSFPSLIILGSGRSGTSMFTGALASSGYYLGKNADYLGSNKSNPKGFFEDLEVNTINEDILRKSLFDIPEKLRRRFFPAYTFYRARWLSRLPLKYSPKVDKEISKRIEKVLSKSPFCYKDPRFSYTLPAWQNFLPENTRFLVVYRNPLLTSRSILKECQESPALRKLKLSHDHALKVWRLMYSHILKTYSSEVDKHKWFFVHYAQAFDKEKMEALQSFLNTKINSDFAEKKLSRAGEVMEVIPEKQQRIYSKLNQLSGYKTT